MDKNPNRLLPVIWGTLAMTMISVLPLINFINIFFCGGIIIGGIVGVNFYIKQLSGTTYKITYKDSGMIGLLSGILSAVLVTGINILMVMYSRQNPVVEVIKFMNEIGTQFPIEIEQQLIKFSDEFNKYGFSPTIAIFSLISNLILYPLFGIVGSLIGTALYIKKKEKSDRMI